MTAGSQQKKERIRLDWVMIDLPYLNETSYIPKCCTGEYECLVLGYLL